MAYILYNSGFDIQSKLYDINTLIDKHIAEDSLNSMIIIVPTGKLVFKFKREIVKKYYSVHGKPCEMPMVYNLQSFASHCFKNYYKDKPYFIVSEAYRNTLFEDAIAKSNLSFYKPNARIKHALVERLGGIIYGIKEDGIKVEDIEIDLLEVENDSKKAKEITDHVRLNDIYEIYKKYQELISPNLFDMAEVLNKLNKDFTEEYVRNDNFSDVLMDNIFPENSHREASNLLIWGFSDFKTPEVEFISHFGKSKIATAIHLDFSEKNGPLFGNLSEVTERLSQAGYSILSFDKELKQSYQDLKPSDFLRKYLFEIDNTSPYTKLNNNLAILEFETIEDEVEYILKLVKYLILIHRAKPTDICIVSRNPSKYAHNFREGFFLQGIPAHVTDRFELSNSSVVNAIFNVLSVISNGFEKDDVFKMLNNRLLNISFFDGVSTRKPDTTSLFYAASELRIRGGLKFGGAKQWVFRLEKAIKFFESVKDKYEDYHEKRDIETKLKHYKAALDDIKILTEIFKIGKDKFSINDFVRLIKNDIIKRFAIQENISSTFNTILPDKDKRDYFDYITIKEQAEKNGKALNKFMALLDEMFFVMNERNPKQVYSLKELIERLKTAVKSEKYQILDKMNYGVTITSIEQIRGLDYKIAILCGVNDGEFPLPYKSEALLGKKLPDSEIRHENSERIQFYQFLTNAHHLLDSAQKKIFISYICKDEGGDVVKSPFLTYLSKITGLHPIRPENINETDNNSDILSIVRKPIEYIVNDNDLYENSKNLDDSFELNNDITISNKTKSNLEYLQNFTMSEIKDWLADTNDLSTLQDDKALQKNVFSASEIEQYVKCPYQYYVAKMLRVDKIEQKEPALTPLELGSLMHSVLYYFYVTIQQDKNSTGSWVIPNPKFENLPELKPVHLEVEHRENYLKILFEIAEMSLQKFAISPDMFKFERDQLLGMNKNGISKKGILETWLDNELGKGEEYGKFKPILFEMGFGMNDGTPPIELKAENGSMKIRGKIDRIELHMDEETNSFDFRIADYKTTIKSDHKIGGVKNFNNFQTPLYTKAAEQLLNEFYGIKAQTDGALYYRLNLPDSGKDKFLSYLTDKNFKELLDASTEKAIEITHNIAEFKFPVEPTSAMVCNYCKFQTLCRVKSRIIREGETDED
ncbi:MAG: PD-(D/E)XK nuclease family protein [Candidatus Kapabacteria bacterium]|nr:PD-(D/E)XK nuclease family protein [Candidatus Kapabacteria bacterium]